MSFINKNRQNALEKAQQIVRSASLHSSTTLFQQNCRDDFLFYEGNQWLASDLAILTERGQAEITANICQIFIDNLSGVEIQSRYRAACRSDSTVPEDDKLTEALTHALYNIQEHNSIPYQGSLKFRDDLICGIGWSYLYKEDGAYKYKYIHPSLVIPDPNDLSPQFTNMRFVIRKWYMSPDAIRKTWPKLTKNLDFENINLYDSLFSPELIDRDSNFTDINYFNGGTNSRYLIFEVQDKVEHKAYAGIDRKGRYFETFNEDEALEIVLSKKDIKEITATRNMRTLFMGDTLLEYGPCDPDIPNQKDFSYIPFVWKRQYLTGTPYGLLASMKSIQRDLNHRLAKQIYLLNSTQVFLEDEGFLEGNDIERMRQELKKRDGVILLPKDSKFQVNSSLNPSTDQLNLIKFYMELLQRVIGVNDEMLGIQTNATSGIAQNIRQVNSVRNNVFAFDAFAEMKKREAEFMLNMFQSSYDKNMAIQILTPEQNEWIILNQTYETKDGTKIFNDIRNLPASIYIEEVPDYRSSHEETQAKLEALLNNPNANLIMLSPEMMKQLGIRDAEKLSQQMRQAMQEQAMMQQGMMPPQGQMQGTSPSQNQQPMPPDQLIQGGM